MAVAPPDGACVRAAADRARHRSHPDEEGQQSAPATDDVDVEGDAKPPVDPSRAGGRPDSTVAAYASGKGAAVNTRVRQRLFSRAVLGDAAAS